MEQNKITDKQFDQELAGIMQKDKLTVFPESLEYSPDLLPDIEGWLKHE